MGINEQLFYMLGRHWTTYLTPLPDNWWLRDDVAPFQQQIVALVRRDFNESTVWGLKDPRLCRLLPLWHRVFEEIGCPVYFLHTIRNPLEVADSLNKRDGLPRNASLILWLLHVLDAERETRSYPRIFITFDQLLEDWRSTMLRVADAFQWDCSEAIRTVGSQIDLFINPGMKHHNRGPKFERDGSLIPAPVADVYDAVVRASMGDYERMETVMDGLSQEIGTATRSLLGELYVPELESQISRALAAEENVAICRTELDRMLKSWSWWLTSPLRRFYDYLTGNKN